MSRRGTCRQHGTHSCRYRRRGRTGQWLTPPLTTFFPAVHRAGPQPPPLSRILSSRSNSGTARNGNGRRGNASGSGSGTSASGSNESTWWRPRGYINGRPRPGTRSRGPPTTRPRRRRLNRYAVGAKDRVDLDDKFVKCERYGNLYYLIILIEVESKNDERLHRNGSFYER